MSMRHDTLCRLAKRTFVFLLKMPLLNVRENIERKVEIDWCIFVKFAVALGNGSCF